MKLRVFAEPVEHRAGPHPFAATPPTPAPPGPAWPGRPGCGSAQRCGSATGAIRACHTPGRPLPRRRAPAGRAAPGAPVAWPMEMAMLCRKYPASRLVDALDMRPHLRLASARPGRPPAVRPTSSRKRSSVSAHSPGNSSTQAKRCSNSGSAARKRVEAFGAGDRTAQIQVHRGLVAVDVCRRTRRTTCPASAAGPCGRTTRRAPRGSPLPRSPRPAASPDWGTARPTRPGSSGRGVAVTGRACSTCTPASSIAHSMSCGAPCAGLDRAGQAGDRRGLRRRQAERGSRTLGPAHGSGRPCPGRSGPPPPRH